MHWVAAFALVVWLALRADDFEDRLEELEAEAEERAERR
jgi:hypothetical protein